MESYESLGPVGEGSYGTVLKCRHRESGRLVAIKKFMDSDEDKTQLRHDNLVNLLMVWKRRRRWYLVFEFVDRTLLEDLEQNPNGLDLNTCRQYMFQILRAATFCHQQNVIHRDIKPENILISQEGVVKLCDFGFARTIASPSEVYTDYVATRWYRAPELLVGDIKYGKPVDVWALGCLLIEVLTGQPLFPGDSDLDQIYHIVKCFGNLVTHHQELFYRNPIFSGVKLPESSSTVPLQQRFPSITQNALDVAQRCLDMDPEGRAQCSELLDHLFFTQDSFHIRCGDKPQQHGGAYDREVQKFTTGHVTGSFTCQVPEHRLMSEKAKNKPHVHFPDVRGSALPDLKEGKPNKASIRNVRKETNPVSSSLVSDVQQQQGPNINTNTPQK
ncbi:cyclin-dependent kinase-like 2 isoform X3 [Nothobranchius furzeri]|uniref:cyclin-dependent kinase-like 2 isoform X3 n=1 Tax=Nothobranchius furzeri TaxID=105023 RepID=UPI003904CA17